VGADEFLVDVGTLARPLRQYEVAVPGYANGVGIPYTRLDGRSISTVRFSPPQN